MRPVLGPKALKRVVARLPHRPIAAPQAFILAAFLVALGALLRFALSPLVGDGVPFITFFLMVLIASVVAGAAAGFFALALSSLVASYFWLAPFGSLMLTPDSIAALVAFWVATTLMIAVAATLQALVAYLMESEARAHVIAHEMKHRVGNMLAIIQAIARQTERGASSLGEFSQVFQARLSALASAQDVIQENPNLPADLRQLVMRIIEPFGHHRFTVGGPDTGADPAIASSLALLIHELGTNAMKYGALSSEAGTVSLRWMIDGDRIVLTWVEVGGPPVSAPDRSGFGSKLLQSAFPPDVGEARIEYPSSGVRCTIGFAAPTSYVGPLAATKVEPQAVGLG
ncbi:sensor histidine kinase [Bosea sp. (in: a-proteobacteria)]|uniref:sensor histidine kinase n=1 Tax=Bosea sp. (in: a-proteobacteria) TaxID=1871050 RepID=UPI0027322F2F|nr:HWE histidine kinase domain-containing protein [Bosea sp. (in: a-proteobacteria)]MDP3406685.1 HWE histidine kinase domain-containing protein [Bosea sp. (in: a-proteobacteria)]